MTRICIGIALMLAFATSAAAQVGHVAGVARDASGAVLPGMTVRAVLKGDTGDTARIVRSDGAGRYDLSLDEGTWTITASLPGFASQERTIALLSGTVVRWDLDLQVGSLQETMVITRDTPPSRITASVAQPAPAPAPASTVQGTPTPTFLPPTPAPGAATPVRVGGNIKAPNKLVNVNPGYPAAAIAQGISGVVILEATIGTNGRVTDARVLRPIPLLDQAALEALRQWEFSPTLLNGQPVPVIMTATFQFTKD